jgi:8-oxo-dGTP pyrophosphatase MutT (NUDIX family)
MPIPEFVVEMRRLIGKREMWLPGVTAVVRRGPAGEEEILLVQRADNGAWTPITGIPEPAEEPGLAAAREALEETGVTVRVDRLASTGVHAGIVHANGDLASYLDLTFACTYVSGEAHVADDESVDVRWFPRDGLPQMAPVYAQRIADALGEEPAARFVR